MIDDNYVHMLRARALNPDGTSGDFLPVYEVLIDGLPVALISGASLIREEAATAAALALFITVPRVRGTWLRVRRYDDPEGGDVLSIDGELSPVDASEFIT